MGKTIFEPQIIDGDDGIYLRIKAPKNWNQYIGLERSNKFAAANCKRAESREITELCKGVKWGGKYPVSIDVVQHFINKNADLDNIRIKGVLDGLVRAGVLVDDSAKYVAQITFSARFEQPGWLELLIRPLEAS